MSFALADFEAEDEYNESYLDSDRYFDYLIERNQLEKNRNPKKDVKEPVKEVNEIILEDYNPIKLKANKTLKNQKYEEVYKKDNPKNSYFLSDKIELYQNSSASLNTQYSKEYKSTTGVELKPSKFLSVNSGVESKFRLDDQNPLSKKLYFSPMVNLGKNASITFHNKVDVENNSVDNDIELKVSPFKSKAADFGVYGATTRAQNGSMSKSINFSTNFYF